MNIWKVCRRISSLLTWHDYSFTLITLVYFLKKIMIGGLVFDSCSILIKHYQMLWINVFSFDFVILLILIENSVRPRLQRDLYKWIITPNIKFKIFLEQTLGACFVYPFFTVVGIGSLLVVMNLLEDLVDLHKVLRWFTVSWCCCLFVPKTVEVLRPIVKQTWSRAIERHVQLFVLPEIKIVRTLPHSCFRIKYVQHGAREWSFTLLFGKVINSYANVGIWCQIAYTYGEFYFSVKLETWEHSSLHFGLI